MAETVFGGGGVPVEQLLAIGAVSLLVATVAAPVVLRALIRLRSRQTVSAFVPEHAAKQGTPTMGGLIILLGLLSGLMVARPEGWLAPLALILGFGAVGFLDDYVVPRWMPGKRGLGWMPKLALEGLAIGVALWVSGSFAAPIVAAMSAFLVLFYCNAYNFADGLDGLAGTLGVILALSLAGLAAVAGSPLVQVTMVALALGYVPFLMLNAPPARVFMGDVGALPLGAVLGWAVATLAMPADAARGALGWLGLAVLSGVMVIELVPVPLQILSVKLRKGKRLFPRTPIHHAFQHAGWPETRVTAMFVLVQLVLALMGGALFLMSGVSS